MKKIIILIVLSVFFWVPTKAQNSLTVPYGSFEQWTTHSGYNASFFGSDLSVYSDYSTPTGWNYLTYPINESISILGINVSINTNLPLIKADQATVSVPDGNSAVKLQSFMIEDLVNPTTYALVENSLDTFLTQTVFPSILSNGIVNVNNFLPLLDSLTSNMSSPAALFSQLGSLNLNNLITGGMALGSFEPSRLTGNYKYQSATSGDNGAVVLLGTHYNTTTNQRDLVGGGINAVLTDATNYTPFTVYYQSLHDLVPTFPEKCVT